MHDRPLVTFGLVTYNQSSYVRLAVQGAFEQSYSPLQIVLSDDNSSDGTWEILKELAERYSGPHVVILNRNASNIGLGAHINALMSLARGELIVIAAGDDVSRYDRVVKTVDAWNKSERRACSLTSNFKKIDERGCEIGEFRCRVDPASRSLVHRARHGCWNVQGCAHSWHRKVFEEFGPLQNYVIAEDRAIEFRSLALGEVIGIDEFLVQYRLHGSNLAAIRDNATRADRKHNTLKINQISSAMFSQFLVDVDRIEALQLCSPHEVLEARELIRFNLSRLSMEREYLGSNKARRLLLGLQAVFKFSPRTGLRWIRRFAR